VNEFGEKGFDYVGDHRNHRAVWHRIEQPEASELRQLSK
jgi:hypothetical protein